MSEETPSLFAAARTSGFCRRSLMLATLCSVHAPFLQSGSPAGIRACCLIRRERCPQLVTGARALLVYWSVVRAQGMQRRGRTIRQEAKVLSERVPSCECVLAPCDVDGHCADDRQHAEAEKQAISAPPSHTALAE